MVDTQKKTEQAASQHTPATRMYGVLVGVGVCCALAIVLVYEATRPVIHRQTLELRKQAILQVLPEARASVAFRLNDTREFEQTSPDSTGPDVVFAGYDADNKLVGMAIETEGMGYQDVIRLIYGYSFSKQAVIGIRVLQSRETPGLGDRIETDKTFLSNFEALDVRLNRMGDALDHPLEFVKPGEKQTEWQIDGISGATISSRATAEMLRTSTSFWIPQVCRRRKDFQSQPHSENEPSSEQRQ